jgi:hypothetical protein
MTERPEALARPLPPAPPGVDRMEHLPTIAASLLYWHEARDSALNAGDVRRARVAAALMQSYEEALDPLRSASRAG